MKKAKSEHSGKVLGAILGSNPRHTRLSMKRRGISPPGSGLLSKKKLHLNE